MEKAFLNLLKNKIFYNGRHVPVIRRYAPIDQTPCITIMQADENFKRRRYVEIDHIQHIEKKYTSDIWINVWCNTEHERQSIIESVKNQILKAEANHFNTCKNYNQPCCQLLKSECLALNQIKKQCPIKDMYSSFFKTNNIVKNTFHINSITDLDELEYETPILRTIFKLQMDYHTYYPIGGELFEEIIIDGDLL